MPVIYKACTVAKVVALIKYVPISISDLATHEFFKRLAFSTRYHPPSDDVSGEKKL